MRFRRNSSNMKMKGSYNWGKTRFFPLIYILHTDFLIFIVFSEFIKIISLIINFHLMLEKVCFYKDDLHHLLQNSPIFCWILYCIKGSYLRTLNISFHSEKHIYVLQKWLMSPVTMISKLKFQISPTTFAKLIEIAKGEPTQHIIHILYPTFLVNLFNGTL